MIERQESSRMYDNDRETLNFLVLALGVSGRQLIGCDSSIDCKLLDQSGDI